MFSNKLMKFEAILKTMVILFMLIGVARAEQVSFENSAKTGAPSTSLGKVTGKISVINKNYIVVVYKSEKEREYEVLLPVDTRKIKIEHKKNLSALSIGDTVSIEYEDTKEETLEGQRTRREAKVISFISPAPPTSPEPPEPEE